MSSYSNVRIMLPSFFPESLRSFVKNNCIPDEASRIEEILDKHAHSVAKFRKMQQEEAGLAQTIRSGPITEELKAIVSELEDDLLFKKNFDGVPHEFRMVELSKLVVFQNQLNLDYSGNLVKRMGGSMTDREVADLCLFSSYDSSTVQFTKTDTNTYLLSSENNNLRFLGSDIKHVSLKDFESDVKGTQTDIIALVAGFGTARTNAISANQRIFANNGIHRAFAMYSKGIEHAPFVILNMANPFSEFPEPFLGVPRNTALTSPRPPLLKDFTDQDLVIDLKAKKTVKMVEVKARIREFEVTI